MKKALVVLVSATIALTACGGSSSTSTTAAPTAKETTATETTKAPETTTAQIEAEDPRTTLQAELKKKYDLDPSNIRNDATGKWRLSKVANTTPPTEYAVEYAKAFMESGDIHWVVNFTLKTTTLFRLQNGIVEAKTTEYVDKEEHDAKIIGEGMLLTDDFYELESGKKIEIEVDENAGTVETDDLTSAVREAIDGSIGVDDVIEEVSFDGKDLKIKIKLGKNQYFEPRDMALSSISSVTDSILEMDDKYYNTWETITMDYGEAGKATLDKSLVTDQGYGKFFDFPDSVLK